MNKFFIIAILFWLVILYYNIFYTFDLMAVIIATTWITLNVLILYEGKKEKSIYPKLLSKRQIKRIQKQMPKGDHKNDFN